MTKFALSCFGVAALMLGGCANTYWRDSEPAPQLVAAPDRVSAQLASAADKASNALQTLAAIEQRRTPPADLARIDNAPVELRRAVTVSWIGPVDKITKTLSDRASYTFAVMGDVPPVPVVVNVRVENTPIIDVLRDIGLQLGGRADVRVDSVHRVIELHYAPVTASSNG